MTLNSINGALSAFEYSGTALPSTYPVYIIDSPKTKTSNNDKDITFGAPTGNGNIRV